MDTLTNDLTVLSKFLSMVAKEIEPPTPTLTVDSNLALLSAPIGCPVVKNLCVPIPAVVVPKPTMFAFASSVETLSFSICNLIISFSILVVTTPTEFVVIAPPASI